MKTVAIYLLAIGMMASLASRALASSRPEPSHWSETLADGCVATYFMATAPNNEPPVEVAVVLCPNGREPQSPYGARQ